MKEGDTEFLRQILDYEQSVDMEEIGKLGWCWRDVRVSPGVLNRLFLEGILENSFKSNSYCGYVLSEQGRALALAAVQDDTEDGTDLVSNDTEVDLPQDLFGEIIGHEDVKDLIRAALLSDKPVHVLLAGPPALAKTLFLWDIERAAGERALWLIGSGTSKAGLWDMVAEKQPRVLLIDELDKMNTADTAALLSLMEGGRLVRAKVGRQMSTTIPAWVLAATNNYQKLSRYPEAWWHLGRCLAPTSQDASLVGEWRREVEEELKKEHVRVRLEVEPLGAAIRLGEGDHSAWYETPLDWWLQPGAHHVLVKAGGGKPQELSFEIVSGMERVALSLPAKEQPADTVVHRPATPIPAPPEDGGPAGVGGGNGQGDPAVPAWKWAVLGSSGALAVGGAVTYHLAASNLSEQQEKHDHWKQETFPPNGEISPGEEETVQSDWDDRFHREVRPYEVTSYVLWGLAGATLLTGAVLLYPDLFPEESTGTSGLAPYLTPGGGGVNAAISF